MLIFSMNYKGLGKPSKKLALKMMVALHHHAIILLQENLSIGNSIITTLGQLLLGWAFSYTNAIGRSGGVITGWSTKDILVTNTW